MSEPLLPIVNASGFAFQLAVEEAVRVSGLEDRHEWEITSREHGWRDGDTPKFIDLVLTLGKVHLIAECKRVRGTDWVFLIPDPPKGRRAEQRRRFRTTFLRNERIIQGMKQAVASLHNFQVEPVSWESSFCQVKGASDHDRPMLDRICAELVRSSDAIAAQQSALDVRPDLLPTQVLTHDVSWVAIPIIVTTARLHICQFDPATVPLADGEIPPGTGHWEQVPFLRYRKSFDAPGAIEAQSIGDLEQQAQRSVFVINAPHFVEWLGEFVINPASYQ